MSIVLATDRTDVRRHARPWWKQGTRVMGNPFSSLGLRYCPVCKGEEDTDQAAEHRAGVYLFKITCRRCGQVIGSGAYKAPLVSDKPLPRAGFEWVTAPGKDRR